MKLGEFVVINYKSNSMAHATKINQQYGGPLQGIYLYLLWLSFKKSGRWVSEAWDGVPYDMGNQNMAPLELLTARRSTKKLWVYQWSPKRAPPWTVDPGSQDLNIAVGVLAPGRAIPLVMDAIVLISFDIYRLISIVWYVSFYFAIGWLGLLNTILYKYPIHLED